MSGIRRLRSSESIRDANNNASGSTRVAASARGVVNLYSTPNEHLTALVAASERAAERDGRMAKLFNRGRENKEQGLMALQRKQWAAESRKLHKSRGEAETEVAEALKACVTLMMKSATDKGAAKKGAGGGGAVVISSGSSSTDTCSDATPPPSVVGSTLSALVSMRALEEEFAEDASVTRDIANRLLSEVFNLRAGVAAAQGKSRVIAEANEVLLRDPKEAAAAPPPRGASSVLSSRGVSSSSSVLGLGGRGGLRGTARASSRGRGTTAAAAASLVPAPPISSSSGAAAIGGGGGGGAAAGPSASARHRSTTMSTPEEEAERARRRAEAENPLLLHPSYLPPAELAALESSLSGDLTRIQMSVARLKGVVAEEMKEWNGISTMASASAGELRPPSASALSRASTSSSSAAAGRIGGAASSAVAGKGDDERGGSMASAEERAALPFEARFAAAENDRIGKLLKDVCRDAFAPNNYYQTARGATPGSAAQEEGGGPSSSSPSSDTSLVLSEARMGLQRLVAATGAVPSLVGPMAVSDNTSSSTEATTLLASSSSADGRQLAPSLSSAKESAAAKLKVTSGISELSALAQSSSTSSRRLHSSLTSAVVSLESLEGTTEEEINLLMTRYVTHQAPMASDASGENVNSNVNNDDATACDANVASKLDSEAGGEGDAEAATATATAASVAATGVAQQEHSSAADAAAEDPQKADAISGPRSVGDEEDKSNSNGSGSDDSASSSDDAYGDDWEEYDEADDIAHGSSKTEKKRRRRPRPVPAGERLITTKEEAEELYRTSIRHLGEQSSQRYSRLIGLFRGALAEKLMAARGDIVGDVGDGAACVGGGIIASETMPEGGGACVAASSLPAAPDVQHVSSDGDARRSGDDGAQPLTASALSKLDAAADGASAALPQQEEEAAKKKPEDGEKTPIDATIGGSLAARVDIDDDAAGSRSEAANASVYRHADPRATTVSLVSALSSQRLRNVDASVVERIRDLIVQFQPTPAARGGVGGGIASSRARFGDSSAGAGAPHQHRSLLTSFSVVDPTSNKARELLHHRIRLEFPLLTANQIVSICRGIADDEQTARRLGVRYRQAAEEVGNLMTALKAALRAEEAAAVVERERIEWRRAEDLRRVAAKAEIAQLRSQKQERDAEALERTMLLEEKAKAEEAKRAAARQAELDERLRQLAAYQSEKAALAERDAALRAAEERVLEEERRARAAHNKVRVAARDKATQEALDQIRLERLELEQEAADKEARFERYFEAVQRRLGVERDTARATQLTEARRNVSGTAVLVNETAHQHGARGGVSGAVLRSGYTDDVITKDPRFRIHQALISAGLQNTGYARELITAGCGYKVSRHNATSEGAGAFW